MLSDREMGLLGGVAFALLYSTLAVPLAGWPTAPAAAG